MTIGELRDRFARRVTSSREVCDDAVARITDPAGEGACTFTTVSAAAARVAADAADALRAAGGAGPLLGVPVSVKDLFDVAGETTRAGSVVLADAPAAADDAVAVARLRAAGAVIVGKTNMSEFAFSGLGINPHYGTPRAPFDRTTGRIPGGSSSGAGVSVADGMAVAAIGTDTGGSVRIPAAFCGLTGFKPTARRVPLGGAYPLSFSLDSIGPLARSVACCATLDAVLAGSEPVVPVAGDAATLRLLAPLNVVLDGLDAPVATAFEGALRVLRAAGAQVDEGPLAALGRLAELQANGGLPAAEAYRFHRDMLEAHGAHYDPQIARRIRRGAGIAAADYIALLRARTAYIAAFAAQSAGYDALLWPTVAIVPPSIAELLADDDRYARVNLLVLRNTSIVNLADGCAVTIPMSRPPAPPAGLMVAAPRGADARVLRVATTIEALLARA